MYMLMFVSESVLSKNYFQSCIDMFFTGFLNPRASGTSEFVRYLSFSVILRENALSEVRNISCKGNQRSSNNQ